MFVVRFLTCLINFDLILPPLDPHTKSLPTTMTNPPTSTFQIIYSPTLSVKCPRCIVCLHEHMRADFAVIYAAIL